MFLNGGHHGEISVFFLTIMLFPEHVNADLWCSLERKMAPYGQEYKRRQLLSYKKELRAKNHSKEIDIGPFRIVKDFDGDWIIRILKISGHKRQIVGGTVLREKKKTVFRPVLFSSEEYTIDFSCEIVDEQEFENFGETIFSEDIEEVFIKRRKKKKKTLRKGFTRSGAGFLNCESSDE